MSLKDECYSIMLDYGWTYTHENMSYTDEIINKILDAAVETAESERLVDETGSTEDLAYDNAIFHVVQAINKLRGK